MGIVFKCPHIFFILDALLKVLVALEDISGSIEPKFIVHSQETNVSGIAGESVTLRCRIEDLGSHKVVWMSPKNVVISQDRKKIIDDTRISVERQVTEDWNILIRNLSYSDGGTYKCTINTEPVVMMIRIELDVKVPASIDDKTSSRDTKAREGEKVQLFCNASGVPMPKITWSRETEYHGIEDIPNPGEYLYIHNITRNCEGLYRCEAINNVKQPVSRAIRVTVEFKPEVKVEPKRLGVKIGQETALLCTCDLSPKTICVWKKDGNELISNPGVYRVETSETGAHTIELYLTLYNIKRYDLGEYVCYAENNYGRDRAEITLYEYTNWAFATTTPEVMFAKSTKRTYYEPLTTNFKPYPKLQQTRHSLRPVKGQRTEGLRGGAGRYFKHLELVLIVTAVHIFCSR